jgi:hypothetical protein
VWLVVIAAAVVGALAALALIATTAKATGPSVRDNHRAALRVDIEPATRPQRLGLDLASYDAHARSRRVP